MSIPLPKNSPYLRARSGEDQRIWHIGDGHQPGDGRQLFLAVRPDRHESFAALDAILGQLSHYAGPAEREAIARVSHYLAEARPSSNSGRSEGSRGRLLADSVTFAIMRRVSRESFYTARVIDLGARTLNGLLARLPYSSIHVQHADRLDRPSLKVLARAMLILEPSDRFAWVWHLDRDPRRAFESTSDLFVLSRGRLLQQLLGILCPRILVGKSASWFPRPGTSGIEGSIEDMAAALVLQNYDHCFLLRDSLLRGCDVATTSEVLRLTGLAAVNVGQHTDALEALRHAELGAGPGRRAHLAYLQGLIEGKRRYDLSKSSAQYERGLALIEARLDPDADLPLERGWLLNGLALNEAILWRRQPADEERHARAFTLEQQAFGLVREGSSPSRIYLRFNLLANCALLMEMCGRHDLAVKIFSKTFDFDIDQDASKRSRWESTMGYRIGVLHYRAGRTEEAYRLLHHASEQDGSSESWPVRERILRALGAVALERGSTSEAESIYRTGLDTCREARAAEGTREHTRGLVASLIADGRRRRAADVLAELRDEESLTFDEGLDDIRPSPPSPKLPAYFPELDLEGIPAIDLNRFLGSPTRADTGAPWQA